MSDYFVLPHEHIFCRFRSADKLQALEFVGTQLKALANRGVTDVVDLTAYTNPMSYLDLVRASPIRIHSCVGFYLEPYVHRAHRALSIDGLIAVMDRKHKRLRRAVPAIAIKVAARSASLSPFERRVFAAAAQFNQLTGLPIVTHSPRGFEQHQSYLIENGVPSGAIMISHPEMSTKGRFAESEAAVLKSMAICAERGSYLCITDLTGLGSKADALRLRLVAALAQAGHAQRLVVSGDSSWKVHRGSASVRNASPGKGYDLVFEVHEKLRLSGIPSDDVDLIVRNNPVRFFSLPQGN